jgi:hypothetical protein
LGPFMCTSFEVCEIASGQNPLIANRRAAVMITCTNSISQCDFSSSSQIQTIWTGVTATSSTSTQATTSTAATTSSSATSTTTSTTTEIMQ